MVNPVFLQRLAATQDSFGGGLADVKIDIDKFLTVSIFPTARNLSQAISDQKW